MSTALEVIKGSQVKPPYGDLIADSNVLKVAVTAASLKLQIPDGWKNGFISAKSDGVDCVLLFSKNASGSVAVPTGAADGDPNPTNGWLLREGDGREDFWVPDLQVPDHNYLYVATTAGSGYLWLYKSSE